MLSIFTVFLNINNAVYAVDNSNLNPTQELEEFYDEAGNYYNYNTGEYFRWENTNERTLVKRFTFKMQFTLTSNTKLKFDKEGVKVTVDDAHFEWASGNTASCCSKHEFEVNIRRYGVTNNVAVFKAPISSKKTVDLGKGFVKNSKIYTLELTNGDELPFSIQTTEIYARASSKLKQETNENGFVDIYPQEKAKWDNTSTLEWLKHFI